VEVPGDPDPDRRMNLRRLFHFNGGVTPDYRKA
jgi:hypothetical protein